MVRDAVSCYFDIRTSPENHSVFISSATSLGDETTPRHSAALELAKALRKLATTFTRPDRFGIARDHAGRRRTSRSRSPPPADQARHLKVF